MKFIPLALCLCLAFSAACGKNIRLPNPGPEKEKQTQEQREITKQKNSFLKKINSLEKDYHRLNSKMLEKRSRGYNTTEAEAILSAVQKSLSEAKDLAYWENFDELKTKLEEIKILGEKAESLIKSAPEFGDRPIKKEKIERKYGLDDRERVREIRGEPDKLNKNFRGSSTILLTIFDPTDRLLQSRCWDGRIRTFYLTNPPGIESWYYPEDQKIYIFMEVNSIIEQFMLKNELTAPERDQLLFQLCETQVYSGYRLVYAGPPVTDVSVIAEQVFKGEMRGADMFGIGALSRLAEATAALPDFSIASVAFNTKIE